MRKTLSLISILILAATGILMVEFASAQTIPKPSVPEFTVTIADHSYDVPETTTSYTNPYTNETTITTIPGYRVANRSIEVSIKNQAFAPYTDADGHTILLYYNISVKPHYVEDWRYYPDSVWDNYNASNSEYTVKTFGFGGIADPISPQIGYVSPGGKVDFRVEAMIGYYDKVWVSIGDSPLAGGSVPVFAGETSGWSSIQTVTTPEAFSPAPTWANPEQSFIPITPTETPASITGETELEPNANLFTIPQVTLSILVAALVIIIAILLVLLIRKSMTYRATSLQASSQ
jgi:hypothetical protein